MRHAADAGRAGNRASQRATTFHCDSCTIRYASGFTDTGGHYAACRTIGHADERGISNAHGNRTRSKCTANKWI